MPGKGKNREKIDRPDSPPLINSEVAGGLTEQVNAERSPSVAGNNPPSPAVNANETSLAELYAKYDRLVRRISTCDHKLTVHDADDVGQEFWLAILQKGAGIDVDAIVAQLRPITRNKSVDHVRRAERQRRLHDEQRLEKSIASPTEKEPTFKQAARAEQEQLLADALATLDPIDAMIVVMRHLEGKTVREVEQAVGLGRTRINERRINALKQLREALGRRGEEFLIDD